MVVGPILMTLDEGKEGRPTFDAGFLANHSSKDSGEATYVIKWHVGGKLKGIDIGTRSLTK
jgi:hypothetical protein